MVLKNYGVKTVAGLETTPASLNAWLKSQPDGYIRNGLVNWLALTRYSRESYAKGKSTTKLEFVKSLYDQTDVTDKIEAGLYPILAEPGHFVTTVSQDATNWAILDPNNESRTAVSKTSTFGSSNTFVPSLTDMSYMLLVYDPGMSVVVSTPGGEVEGIVTEEYLADDQGGAGGKSVKLQYVPKPASGNYNLATQGKGQLDMYLYDEKGSVWTKKLTVDESEKIEFSYNRTNIIKTKIENQYRRVWKYLRHLRRWTWYWHKDIWPYHWF